MKKRTKKELKQLISTLETSKYLLMEKRDKLEKKIDKVCSEIDLLYLELNGDNKYTPSADSWKMWENSQDGT
jgi:hypothetical protein